MHDSVRRRGLEALKTSRSLLLKLISDIPEGKLCAAPLAGGNHALWTLGHLAWADELFLMSLTGEPSELPEAWAPKFGMGSTPTPDPSQYPPIAELKQAAGDVRDRLTQWFEGASEAEMTNPVPKPLEGFASDIGQLMFSIAGHEWMHAGQLTVVRKSLGLKRLIG